MIAQEVKYLRSVPFGLGAGSRPVLVGLVLSAPLPSVPVEERA